MARGQRWILYKLKERWLEAGLPIQIDKNIIAKMKVVYKEYTNARKSVNRMGEGKRRELVDRWGSITFDLSVNNWEAAIHADPVLGTADKEQKITLMLDCLGEDATRYKTKM